MSVDRGNARQSSTPALRQEDARAASGLKVLIEVLGAGLVAVIADTNVATVNGWTENETPSADVETGRKLGAALHVVDLLLQHDSSSVVRAWFMGMNPQLDDESPVELLAKGRLKEVLATARHFADVA